MKIVSLIVAGLAAATLAPVAAQAQRHDDDRRIEMRDHGRRHHEVRRVCRTEIRHHHRVQVCRTVRR